MQAWNILLVDDESDVHEVTRLALKHRRWRKRPFELTSLMSMKDAVALFESNKAPAFQVAIVDVVMEKEDAGLRLCEYIRAHCPSSLRIVLRTGQPGVAPEEHVLNEYDIDYYLAKSEATPDKLYSIIRACLRSSQDISTLLAFGRQLQSFCRALQEVTSVKDLLVFMAEALQFLELKHSIQTVFNYDLNAPNESNVWLAPRTSRRSSSEILEAMRKALATGKLMSIHSGADFGLPSTSFIIPFESTEQFDPDIKSADPDVIGARIPGALYFEIAAEVVSDKARRDIQSDAVLFLDNWRIAYATLLLQERYAKERMLREKMYFERVQGIAKMVTGVAHELNTPLGVANTANSMLVSLARDLTSAPPGAPEVAELIKDIEESCKLMTKNLARTQTLIKSFKQLSASQLSDQRGEYDIVEVVKDCVESSRPETKKHQVAVTVHSTSDKLIWDGYPSHLSQVILNMIQNVIRYAYPEGTGGKFDIRISETPAGYRMQFEDYGAGIAAEVEKNLFEPFVTSGRGKGGTGLGLAITRNIVTNLLGGAIAVQSRRGAGTKFTVDLPRVVPGEARKPEEGIGDDELMHKHR